jgi:osmotically-inducible protein OsmY
MKRLIQYPLLLLLSAGIACSTPRSSVSYEDAVKRSLEQAELKDVNVSEDRSKNTITLTGKLHSEDAKARAADVAKGAAGERIIANEISVEPVGVEAEARKIESNVDDGIQSNYKAALIAHRLDREHIRFSVKNGVLTLKGSVRNSKKRDEAQELASSVPNVEQVVNEIKTETQTAKRE